MQTFLPLKSFVASMEALDYRRLGKQRIEACQILETLLKQPFSPKNIGVPLNPNFKGWRNHPAVRMWEGHEEWLKLYTCCCIGEWEYRGYANNIQRPEYNTSTQPPPPWLGLEEFHLSHRSNLLRKDFSHYSKFWPDDPRDLPYFWPTQNMENL